MKQELFIVLFRVGNNLKALTGVDEKLRLFSTFQKAKKAGDAYSMPHEVVRIELPTDFIGQIDGENKDSKIVLE